MEIDTNACRRRQQRLLEVMRQKQIDAVIVSTRELVQYLFGPRFAWLFEAFGVVLSDGRSILIGPESRIPDTHGADEVLPFPARFHSTVRNDQREVACQVLMNRLRLLPAAARVGVEFSQFTRHWNLAQHLVDIEPDLFVLRRRKEPDELAKIERATAATEAMYTRAREIVRPGVNELDVYNELQAVAIRSLGEPWTAIGNDYRCGARGGAPRDRLIEAGELYILDLGPAYQGYFADNARTLAVSEPTTKQLTAWSELCDIFTWLESQIRPGVSAPLIFQQVQERLDRASVGVFNHHLGHGIGLFPHEAPHLNPHWNDNFEVGDVFTAEPGLYAPELNAGLRLENTYVVEENGIRRLTNFPLELKL